MTVVMHGTVSAYTFTGCRCGECKRAKSDYTKAWEHRRNAPSPGERVLPVEPLLDVLRGRTAAPAAYLHVSQTRWRRWLTEGIPYFAADRVAARLGKHPVEIFGAQWFDEPGGDA